VYYPTSKMAAIQSIKCAYDFQTPSATICPLPRWLAIVNLPLLPTNLLLLPLVSRCRCRRRCSRKGQPYSPPRDARRGAAARSSSCSSKTCLLISYTTNAFPVRIFPLVHPLIAAHVLSQSSRVNMSLPVRLQLPAGIHDVQLTSIPQYSITIPVRRSLQARWMTFNFLHLEQQPR
jgi:hypothetical protein